MKLVLLQKRDGIIRRNIGVRMLRFGLIAQLCNPIFLEILFKATLSRFNANDIIEIDNFVLDWFNSTF